jgi:phenylpropionate dioxygenase-like ring-hydroxylating dioxygenase large terminal subunit
MTVINLTRPGTPDLDQILAGIKLAGGTSVERAITMPPAAYTSEDLYRLEIEKLFRPGWVAIARTDQVSQPGDYFCVDLVGEPLVVTRDRDGELYVLSRVCLHRWMEVATGSGNAAALQCPYHLWTYSLSGHLVGAPEMQGVEAFDKSGCRLPEVRFEVWKGFIFVNLDGQADPLAPTLTPLNDQLNTFGTEDHIVVDSVDWGVCPWDWKIMIENFMECYHHAGSHRKTLEDRFPARLTWTDTSNEFYSIMHTVPADDALPEDDEMMVESGRLVHIYPLTILSVRPSGGGILRVLPLGPGRIRLITDMLVPRDAVDEPDFAEKLAKRRERFKTINLEDVETCSRVQKGATAGLADVGRLSRLEQPLWEFYSYLADHLA